MIRRREADTRRGVTAREEGVEVDLRPEKVGMERVDIEEGGCVILVEDSWRRAAEGERVVAAWERAKEDAAMARFRERKLREVRE